MIHLIAIPMTGMGLHGGFRGDAWYRGRIEIFKKYTLKSLANQKNQNFVLWLWFRPEEAHNPLTYELLEAIEEAGLSCVPTFHGLMYIDDRFLNFNTKTIFKNLLMMAWDMWKYKEWKNPFEVLRNAFENKNKTLPKRLSLALQVLREYFFEEWNKEDWVYLSRIDSDDMFHKDAMEVVSGAEPQEGRALIFDKGYVYNHATGQLADWNPTTTPPFWTLIFPTSTFFDFSKHLEYYGEYKSHESIGNFENVILPDDKYVQVVNHSNVSTYWNTKMYLVTSGHRNVGTNWNLNKVRTWWIKRKNPQVANMQEGIHPFIGEEKHGIIKEQILKNFGL